MFHPISIIIKDGIRLLFKDIEGKRYPQNKVLTWFLLCPLLLLAFIWCINWNIISSVEPLLTCLSIFLGLIFSALFVVPEKLQHRIERLKNKDDEVAKNYIVRYSNFTRLLFSQISFVIVLSLTVIVLLILQRLTAFVFIAYIAFFLFFEIILYLLLILSNIHILVNDDIDRAL